MLSCAMVQVLPARSDASACGVDAVGAGGARAGDAGGDSGGDADAGGLRAGDGWISGGVPRGAGGCACSRQRECGGGAAGGAGARAARCEEFAAAVGQYEFLRTQYPGSSLRVGALLAEGQIYENDLHDAAAARESMRCW